MIDEHRAEPSSMPVRAQSALLDALFALSGTLPRGKAALPRFTGRLLLGKDLYSYQMPSGFKMLWVASTIDMLVNYRRVENWDNHVLAALLQEARPGAVCYDIGANAGYMTLSLANRVPDLELVAFEPLPNLAETLARSVQINGFDKVVVMNVALTDQEQTLDLHLPAHTIHASLKPRGRGTTLKVAGLTLDSLVASGVIRPPDLMKVDIEGAEMLLFVGARNVLRTHGPTLVFECDENSLRFGHSPADVIAFLREQGYDKFERLAPGQEPTLLEGDALDAPPFGDFRARSTDRAALLHGFQ